MTRKTLNLLITLFLASSPLVYATNPYTPAGHEGYVYETAAVGTGGFVGTQVGPKSWGFTPWWYFVINIDMRPSTYKEDFQILAKDDLNITFSAHAILSVRNGSVKEVVERFGAERWYEQYVQETFRTYVREAVQSYSSKDAKEKRKEVQDEVHDKLVKYLSNTPFEVINVVVGNIQYPEAVAKAVERKLETQQLLEQKETQKEIAKQDALIKIEEAKGIAEAQKIINASLTELYIQHEAIKAQERLVGSQNHSVIYIPVGTNGVPVVDTVERPHK